MADSRGTADSKPISEAVEEAASDGLGVQRWDRPMIFRETAEAAVGGDVPYWVVLMLSGAIATLGLALNSAAVVIGAMLVAPLLAPVTGLALALAVGDGRLALQTALVVAGSTVAVVAVSALLTALLPFHTITLEISTRTKPSTLDLGIAVFSGLVGALVTVARGRRLSAAIPGVAVAVALIPPLAVTGFGIGSGWQATLIYGSLLLYGANLAGIVLAGMTIFLLVGMHRSEVVETAIEWHRTASPRGLSALADRLQWIRSMGILRTAWARVGLVLVFVAAVWFPLRESLREIAREARIEGAISEADDVFERPGQSAILNRQIVPRDGHTQVYLRVATVELFGTDARTAFEREASSMAGEPVRLSLEQFPTTSGDLDDFATLLGARDARAADPPAREPEPLEAAVGTLRLHLDRALNEVVLPDDTEVVGAELAMRPGGDPVLRFAYASREPLSEQAAQMLVRQLRFALDLPGLGVRFVHVTTTPRAIDPAAPDPLLLQRLEDVVQRFDSLYLEVTIPEALPAADSLRLARRLRQLQVDSTLIRFRRPETATPDATATPEVSVRVVRVQPPVPAVGGRDRES